MITYEEIVVDLDVMHVKRVAVTHSLMKGPEVFQYHWKYAGDNVMYQGPFGTLEAAMLDYAYRCKAMRSQGLITDFRGFDYIPHAIAPKTDETPKDTVIQVDFVAKQRLPKEAKAE